MRAKLQAAKAKALSLARKPNARKAAVLTGLMYLSPVIGLLLDNILARSFGVNTALDFFRLVTSFLMLGTGLVAGTLLKYAIIPQLARAKAANDMAGGLRFVIAITAHVFLLMIPMILCGLLKPDWLLSLLGPGLPIIPEAHTMVQVAAIGFAFMIVSSAGASLLQFYGTFWTQPAAQVVLNSTLMVVILAFAHQAVTLSEQLQILTWGLTTGLIAWLGLFAFMLGRLWRQHFRNTGKNPSPQSWRENVLLAAVALAPQLLIMGCEIFKNIAINRALSFGEPGSLALYTFAFKLLMLVSLPIMAITTILFPRTASNHATGISNHKQDQQQLYALVSVALIITLVLWMVAPVLISILFGLAKLSATEFTKLVEGFRILIWMAPASAAALVISNQCYAMHQRWPILAYYILLTSTLALLLLSEAFLNLNGIIIAVTLSQMIATLAFWMMWRRVHLVALSN